MVVREYVQIIVKEKFQHELVIIKIWIPSLNVFKEYASTKWKTFVRICHADMTYEQVHFKIHNLKIYGWHTQANMCTTQLVNIFFVTFCVFINSCAENGDSSIPVTLHTLQQFSMPKSTSYTGWQACVLLSYVRLITTHSTHSTKRTHNLTYCANLAYSNKRQLYRFSRLSTCQALLERASLRCQRSFQPDPVPPSPAALRLQDGSFDNQYVYLIQHPRMISYRTCCAGK